MKTKIRKLLQIGIIVESVDEAVRNYEMILGIGPWEINTVSGEDEPFRDLEIDGVSRPEKICKLALTPVTGRTHQLRLHCAHMGFPILGDPQYGSGESQAFSAGLGLTFQQLCAKKLTFLHPFTGQIMHIETGMDV